MNAQKLSLFISLVVSLSLFSACEREAVGETYAGQVRGGSSVELSWDSPPRGTTEAAGVPAERPEYEMHGTVPANEPSIHALLGTSGINMRDNVPLVHLPDLAAIAAAEAAAAAAAQEPPSTEAVPPPPVVAPPTGMPMQIGAPAHGEPHAH